MKCLTRLAPQTVLGRWTLKAGCKYIGVFMCCLTVICVIVFLVEIAGYKNCKSCTDSVLHGVYSFNINIIMYCLCMFFVNLWFIWAVYQEKPAVVLIWVVLTTMWWLQGSTLVLIFILLNIDNISISWVATLCVSALAFVLIGYFILVGYGFWLQIKPRIVRDTTTVSTEN